VCVCVCVLVCVCVCVCVFVCGCVCVCVCVCVWNPYRSLPLFLSSAVMSSPPAVCWAQDSKTHTHTQTVKQTRAVRSAHKTEHALSSPALLRSLPLISIPVLFSFLSLSHSLSPSLSLSVFSLVPQGPRACLVSWSTIQFFLPLFSLSGITHTHTHTHLHTHMNTQTFKQKHIHSHTQLLHSPSWTHIHAHRYTKHTGKPTKLLLVN
jgi:hypothetical protein